MKRIYFAAVILIAIECINSFPAYSVCDNVTVSGTVGSSQSSCGNFNPANIVNVTYPTGGTGTLQYQWQVSSNGTSWTDIAGATLESYDPPLISSTTYYHRLERRSSCTVYAGTSNTIVETVNALPTASITAGGPTIFCSPGSVTLTANAAAGTTYQWKKNGAAISGATLQTYAATTTGSYTVVKTVTATGCNATSNAISVTVETALTTTITEPGFNICGASTVMLEAPFAGNYSYQWYEDANALPNTNNYQYSTGHNGNYSCMITNTCGSYPSATYVLNNWLLAQFAYGYINSVSGVTSICNGGSVMLMENFGYPTYQGYQWYKDGQPIAGANDYFYTVTVPGNYVLRITDLCWQTFTTYDYYTNWIVITSNGQNPPTPSVTALGPTTFCFGGNVTLNETTGNGWTYQWQLNNQNINTYTQPSYVASSSGTYRCVVSNACGSVASNAITVIVQPVSVLTTVNGTGTICAGTAATLSATSAGSGGTYQWKLNGGVINGATNATYAATVSGSYTCSITNSCGTFTSFPITITVSSSCTTGLQFDGTNDYVLVPFNNAYSFGSGNFTIEFWMKADPSQTVTQPVLISNRTSGFNGFTLFMNNNTLSFTTNGGTINLSRDLRDNVCHHVAVVRNNSSCSFYIDGVAVGSATMSASVSTTGALAFGALPASGLSNYKGNMMEVRLWNVARTGTQIQSSMNVTLAGNETGLAGYWKLNDGSGQIVNDFSSVNNDGQLGSTPGTDTNDPSFQSTCPLSAAVNCILPANLTTTNITNTSAQLNWNGSVADSFMVRYAVHNTANYTWKKISGQFSSTSITGLLPATQYDWWVRSLCNSISSSNYQTSPATFTTTSTPVPCVTPYNLGASGIGNTSATITWTTFVTADTFRVRYSVNGTTNFIWKDVNGSGGSSTSLTGLLPNTTYQFQVSSKCVGVTSAYSTPYVFTTLNTPVHCAIPYNLSASNIGNTSVTISWTNLVSADTFRVRYSVNGTTNFIWKDVNGAGGSSTTLINLVPNTTYQFQVSSKCMGVTGPYSSSYIFTTLNTPVPCIVPYGLSTTNITSHAAQVNWTNLVSADTFRVRYSINGTTNFIWKDVNGAGGTTNTTLTGLNSSSTYQWQVSTICLGHSSSYSPSVIFSSAALRLTHDEGSILFNDAILYPNPTHGNATLAFSSDEDGEGLISITDLTGREIRITRCNIHSGMNAIEIVTEDLPRGIYIVQAGSQDVSIKLRLVLE